MGQQNQSRTGKVRNEHRLSRQDQVERMSLRVLEIHKDLIVDTQVWEEEEFSPLMDRLHDAVDATSRETNASRRAKSIVEQCVHPLVLTNPKFRTQLDQAHAIVTRHVQNL